MGCDQLLCNNVNCTPRAQSPALRLQPQAPSPEPRCCPQAPCQAARSRGGQRGPAELSHRNHRQHTHHQQHGQRRQLHHGGRRVHEHADGLGRSDRSKLRSHTGAALTITRAASAGPLDCESLDCTFTATSGGVSMLSVSAPQLFASNTLTVTNTSDFSDDLFLTKNWAGWSKLQISNNSAAPANEEVLSGTWPSLFRGGFPHGLYST